MIELSPKNGWISMDGELRRPWYTSGALEMLDVMDLKGKYVWEWGGGNSTIWYRSRGAFVLGVDSDKEWANNVGLEFITEKEAYLKAIHKPNKHFDVIAIDGEYRDECLGHALAWIKPNGIIIADNFLQPSAGWPDWHRTLDLLAVKGLPHTVFREKLHSDWSSLVIYA